MLSLEDKKDKGKEPDKGTDAMDAMDAFGVPTDGLGDLGGLGDLCGLGDLGGLGGLGSLEPDPLAAGDSWGMKAPQFDDPFRTAEFEDVAGFPETCL